MACFDRSLLLTAMLVGCAGGGPDLGGYWTGVARAVDGSEVGVELYVRSDRAKRDFWRRGEGTGYDSFARLDGDERPSEVSVCSEGPCGYRPQMSPFGGTAVGARTQPTGGVAAQLLSVCTSESYGVDAVIDASPDPDDEDRLTGTWRVERCMQTLDGGWESLELLRREPGDLPSHWLE